MTIWKPRLEVDKPRYLAIVDALADDIESGKLDEGFRLPTHRELADALEVSVGTVTRAYATAEKRGLIRGETGRGTFVGGGTGADALPVSDTGETVHGAINLGMTWPLDGDNPDLAPVLRKIARSADHADLLTYPPNAGRPRHRAAGVEWIARMGMEAAIDDVAICAGSQHAMNVVFGCLARPGDTVFTEECTYAGLRAIADFLGLKVVGLPMDAEGLIPDAFEAACRQRRACALYCVPTLQNPTAAIASADRRRQIAAIATENNVPIVEDAIHQRLIDDPPPLLASFAPQSTYLIAGPSKVVAGGLRIAYLLSPGADRDRVARNIWATTWMAAPLNAEIMARWIEDGTAEDTITRKRTETAARMKLAADILPADLVDTGVTSFHIWLRLPDAWAGAAQFVQEARRRGVAVTAADAFHVGSTPPPRAVRISLSAPRTRAAVRTGLERVARTLAQPPGPGVAIV